MSCTFALLTRVRISSWTIRPSLETQYAKIMTLLRKNSIGCKIQVCQCYFYFRVIIAHKMPDKNKKWCFLFDIVSDSCPKKKCINTFGIHTHWYWAFYEKHMWVDNSRSIHSFTYLIFGLLVLCIRHTTENWIYNGEQNTVHFFPRWMRKIKQTQNQ